MLRLVNMVSGNPVVFQCLFMTLWKCSVCPTPALPAYWIIPHMPVHSRYFRVTAQRACGMMVTCSEKLNDNIVQYCSFCYLQSTFHFILHIMQKSWTVVRCIEIPLVLEMASDFVMWSLTYSTKTGEVHQVRWYWTANLWQSPGTADVCRKLNCRLNRTALRNCSALFYLTAVARGVTHLGMLYYDFLLCMGKLEVIFLRWSS